MPKIVKFLITFWIFIVVATILHGFLAWSINQFIIDTPKVYIDTQTGCRYLFGKYYIMPALTSDGDVSNCSMTMYN